MTAAAVTLLTAEQLRAIVREAVREELKLVRSEDSDVLDTEAAGELLRMHPAVVARRAKKHELPGHQLPGGQWRFRRAELLAWLAEQKGRR